MKISLIIRILLVTMLILIGMVNTGFCAPTHSFPNAPQSHAHSASPSAPHVVIHMRHIDIPKVENIQHPEYIVHDHHLINFPHTDGEGARINQRASTLPPQHQNIIKNKSLVEKIQQQKQTETNQNQFYWHSHQNMKYAHYRDSFNNDWYGFYQGPSFYWTRHHAGRWWWYDTRFARWVFWSQGFWWWPSPIGYLYVYTDNNYYPYQDTEGGVTVMQPEIQQPPAEIPTEEVHNSFQSPDGRRLVQIAGSNNEAFLYDTTGDQPAFLKFLGSGVSNVQYSNKTTGNPLQILVNFNDGSYALFDADGNSLQAPSVPTEDEFPGPPNALPPTPAGS